MPNLKASIFVKPNRPLKNPVATLAKLAAEQLGD